MSRRVSVPLCALAAAFSIPVIAFAGPMGGSTVTAITPTIPEVDMYNHTLLGEPILAKEVVTRNRWGTPMPPDGKGSYSLIAPLNPEFIAQSLVIPPLTDGPVYYPRSQMDVPGRQPEPAPASGASGTQRTAPVAPTTTSPAPEEVTPDLPTVEPSGDTAGETQAADPSAPAAPAEIP